MDTGSKLHSRKRSRSPAYNEREDVKKHRSRSPHRKHTHHHHHHHHRRRHEDRNASITLPLNAQPLDKREFKQYEGLFARYLDIQKQINIDEIAETEVKGRWKSFVGKWNRGELAEGWYDPEARWRAEDRWKNREAQDEEQIAHQVTRRDAPISSPGRVEQRHEEKEEEKDGDNNNDHDDDDDDDDGYGPAPPSKATKALQSATIPNVHDLEHRQALSTEAHLIAQAQLQHDRKLDIQLQKQRLDDLAPRYSSSDAGTRERRLAKKAEHTASTLHAFREAKDGGEVDVSEAELMGGGSGSGGGGGGVGGEEDDFQRHVQQRRKAKSEREIRKEEALRARMAEREERMRGVRQKEERTMEMLRGIAERRFG